MPKTASSHVDKYRQQATELRQRAQSTRNHDQQTRLRAMAEASTDWPIMQRRENHMAVVD
jgi:hypothetical protein